jgi:hypothetical protein
MGKDNVLGHDPLEWMKVTKENKKPFSVPAVDGVDKNIVKGDQQISSLTTAKQQISIPKNNDKPLDVSRVSHSQGKVDGMKVDSVADSPVTPKPKVVIGRLYEKLPAEKSKPTQHNEGMLQESKPYIEPSFPVSRAVQPITRNNTEINRVSHSISADHFSTYLIIAYTALMLILGYFVYNDLSKRTSRVEARLFAIEKALHRK